MPHCIIEHSNNIDGKSLVSAVYSGAKCSQLFAVSDIKVRTMSFDVYQAGDGVSVPQSFVHVTTKILSGRSLEQRSELSRWILSELDALTLCDASITVEVVGIETASYAKKVR